MKHQMKTLSILGSTGSIGTQTLELVRRDHNLRVAALCAHGNIELLEAQIREFSPKLVCVYDEKKAELLRQRLREYPCDASCRPEEKNGTLEEDNKKKLAENREKIREGEEGAANLHPGLPKIVSGMEGLIACASFREADMVVVAVVGMIGIRPTIAAIKAGKTLALANKETLVCAGHIIMPMLKEYGVKLFPVDSEHSAIYQCLIGERHGEIDKLLLTASGGPFRGKDKAFLETVTLEDALKHPNWSMGAKITIDSSTMVNKALEVMEAHWLFDVPVEDIEVVVQPKSIIHSMVQFKDGAVKAQLGVPSMLLPIAYAIYEERRMELPEEKLDFRSLGSIALEAPDLEVFEGLKLGIKAGTLGGSMPTVYNAANEEAVAAFLQGRIRYLDIVEGIRASMEAHETILNPTLSEVFAAESWARAFVRERYGLSEAVF